jgi:hypothetical protein
LTNVLENSILRRMKKNMKINAGIICIDGKKITITDTGVSVDAALKMQ